MPVRWAHAGFTGVRPAPMSPHGARSPQGMATTREDSEASFRAVVQLDGKTTTGIRVPVDVVSALGSGKQPAVRVPINGHIYRSTVAAASTRCPSARRNRSAAGVATGDQIEVRLALDTEPRELAVPDDFSRALDARPEARRFFDALSYSQREAARQLRTRPSA